MLCALASPAATPPALVLSNLWSVQNNDVTPLSGFAGTTSFQLSNDIARFRYTGPDGVLEYQWQRPGSAKVPFWGTITLNAQMAGDAAFSVPVGTNASLSWAMTTSNGTNGWQATNVGVALVRTFRAGTTNAVVRITGQMVGKCLTLAVTCDQPWVTAMDANDWAPLAGRRQVVTPFYSGQVYFMPSQSLFATVFLDWTGSAASSHSQAKATYTALTGGARNRLQERAVFSAAWHLAEALPNLPNPPSPHREFLANKVVMDIWSGTFTNIAGNLTNYASYGITNCVAIIHDWQRSGYDNALPAHYPAQAGLGGDAGMSNLVATGLRLGVRCALHENYVDYYPNYDYYDTNDIALDSSGNLMLAWFNSGTGIQSFAEKPNAILRLAATQSPVIHARYGTRANYLDVHSAVEPWFHVDQRASETGAGLFQRVWDVHRQLWAYERATHDGPVFGEGNNHWRWSGCLDGVEAQFGTGWIGNGGLSAPLNVDFDLLRIHPLQFNHGLGYYSRWWPDSYDTNWAGPAPMIVLDQYRMQEVAYAHAAYLDTTVYDTLPLAWLEHHLLSPVAARYGAANPVEIAYEVSGGWLDATAAAKSANGGTNNRVRVTYDNGLVLTANSSSNVLVAGAWTLPQFGWVAQGAGVTAGTITRAGVVTDFADTGDTLFVNARSVRDWNVSSYRRVQPSVGTFQQTAVRTFRVTYLWAVQDSLAKNYNCFVHFCTNGAILWQQDHALTPPTSQWTVGTNISDGSWTVTIPSNTPNGDYDWLIGLYDQASGARLRLQGVDDGSSRIRLGVLHVTNSGTNLSFTAQTGSGTDPSGWYHQHLNESNVVVDFGDVRTDGSATLRRDGKLWALQTLPRDRSFTLELSAARFGLPASVQSVGGSNASVTPVALGDRWRLPLNGATAYYWTNDGTRSASCVATGAVWKHLDTGVNLSNAWRALTFNDSAWPSGPAQLGFGDGDEATVIASNRQWTTYFRRTFVVTNAAALTALNLRLLRDDGAVVYLNGFEVFRSNMPTNTTITYTTPASSSVPAGDETTNFYSTAVSPLLLVNGTNILAVEVHQSTITSSDLSFDLDLTATVNEAPSIALTAPADGLALATTALMLSANATDPENAVSLVEFFADGAKVGQTTSQPYALLWSNVPPGVHTLTARVTDYGGRTADAAPVHVNIGAPVTTLVATGAVWKYCDIFTNLGTAWRLPAFDDSAWPSGPAQLGFGDGDEATLLNTNRLRITTYFRRAFVAPAPTNFAQILVRLLRDDGAVVYLNGAEVFRSNMPTGAVDYLTLASLALVAPEENTFYPCVINPSFLVAGTNVLAVEVHQGSTNSSDLSFDLGLSALPAGAIPSLQVSRAGPLLALTWPSWADPFAPYTATNLTAPAVWTVLTNAPVLSNGWQTLLLPTAPNAASFYRLQWP